MHKISSTRSNSPKQTVRNISNASVNAFANVVICVRKLFILLRFCLFDLLKSSEIKVVQRWLRTSREYPFIPGGKIVRLHCSKINMKADVWHEFLDGKRRIHSMSHG